MIRPLFSRTLGPTFQSDAEVLASLARCRPR